MNEEVLKKINYEETINKALPAIIEAFVTFYGESERERITTRFKNMLIIGYCKPTEMDYIIEESEVTKATSLIKKFLSKIKIKNINKTKLKKILFLDIDKINDYPNNIKNIELRKLRETTKFDDRELLEHPEFNHLSSYIDYLNGNIERKQEVIEFLSQIYPEVTIDTLDKLISQNKFIEIDNIIPLYEELLKTYNKFSVSTKPYKEHLDKYLILKNALAKKYLKKLVSELKEILSEDEFKLIEEEYQIIERSTQYQETPEIYLNRNLLPTYIDAFSKYTEEILNKEDDWRKESVYEERVIFLKKLGLDLGDDYLTYENSIEAKKLFPSKGFVDKLISTREKLYMEMKEEYYNLTLEYQINREKINNLNLLDKDDGYGVVEYEEEFTGITNNIKKVDNNYISYPLLLLYLGNDGGYLDNYLIHELNHIVETSLKKYNHPNYEIYCGWEILTGELEDNPNKKYSVQIDEEKREYELFNEIINELITQDITKILFASNHYIFNNKDNAVIFGGTNYEHTRFLVEEFYETYKKEIIESRKNGNIQVIYDTVGKDNFQALNQLLHIYNKYFSGEAIYEVYEDLEKGIETKKTKIYYELETKKAIILSDMKEYQKNTKTKKLSV